MVQQITSMVLYTIPVLLFAMIGWQLQAASAVATAQAACPTWPDTSPAVPADCSESPP
jgi:hypothetical protein